MPFTSFQITGGADTNLTPALNQASLSGTQLIRYMQDQSGKILVQKLGGWRRFYPYAMESAIYNIWPWQDLNAVQRLAVGMEKSLSYVERVRINGNDRLTLTEITPRTATHDVAPNFSTVAGSNIVTVVDVGSATSSVEYIHFITPVSITGSGIVLYGVYTLTQSLSADSYRIAANTLATATVNNAGELPEATTTVGTYQVTVKFTGHGLSIGSEFAFPIPLVVDNLTLSGVYAVTSVIDANRFVISADSSATSAATATENSGNVRILYYISVLPAPFGSGYGRGGYGRGGYGTGTDREIASGTPITATDWSLDNWGQLLIACPAGGPIYYWSPNGILKNMQLVGSSAPTVNDGMFVAMPQRQIVAWGSTVTGVTDPLLVRWCDVEDFNEWVASSINQAGQYRIPRGSRVVGAMQVSSQGLIWTDLGLWTMQYIGQSLIYSFNEVGNGCGLIARKAMGTNNNITYWMSQSQFFRYGNNGLETLYCPIWDVVFQQLDQSHVNSIRCAVNSRFNEVSWFYPTIGSNGVNTNYVKFNFLLQQWDFGVLGRTAWTNQSVLGPPIGAGVDNILYQHETGPDAGTDAMVSSFETGYFAISDGDAKIFIDQIWPDFKYGRYNRTGSATLQATFSVTDFPGDAPRKYGPYEINPNTKFLNTRFRGRLVSVNITSKDFGSFWRIGQIRFQIKPDGKY